MKKRYSVLTYIIGNYEFVREIDELDPEAEYILVTDNPEFKSETWKVIYDEELAQGGEASPKGARPRRGANAIKSDSIRSNTARRTSV